MNKKFIYAVWIFILCFIFYKNHAFAFDLDMTVDDEIRKNYNSSKLIQDTGVEESETLPALPPNLKNEQLKRIENTTFNNTQTKLPSKNVTTGKTKIRTGTSFKVVNTTKISDWQTKGTVVKFKTNMPVNARKYSIPTGTFFTGEVIESHQPQISGNGGLVVIRIRSMNYNGQTVPLNAYVTRAEDKMIFLNNIKGKRTFLKTMWAKGNWGRTIFNRMLTLTVNLGGEGSTLLFSPFPFAYGTLCLGLNTLTSPICAFFSKGGHVNIPSGSNFRIKLLDDAYIN